MKNTSVLGVPISMINQRQLLKMIDDAVRSGQQMTIVAVNARKIVRAIHEPEMKRLLMGYDVFLADGLSVARAAGPMTERITGVDLMEEICRQSARTGAKLFFYGATEENNLAARKKLKTAYPGMRIAGHCNGYEDEDVVEKIRESGADVVFVAKGTPLQEKWIMKHGKSTGSSILMGVGGAFDVLGGKVKRAPGFIQNMGLEWLYRMAWEPKRFQQIPELLEFRRLVKKEKSR
ncbi:MAG TPA: WecB/TagA/CpsF family glycosyltransferase [Candidatus Mediterraneibacter pullistercoris]|nr:WecB/TagA/CpsF family glycosyltransferase [Candidatus Mediterraneibacter pullistercoris]